MNVYVGEDDGKLHFVNSAGADSVLPFNSGYQYKEVSLSGLQKWATGFTFNSSDYGVDASKCVMMYFLIYNMRNNDGDNDTACHQSHSSGVLKITFDTGIARPDGSKLIIIYTD